MSREQEGVEGGLAGYEFRCRRSGNCCARPGGRVRFSADTLEPLAQLLGLEVPGLLSLYLVPGPDGDFLAKEGPGGECVFLASEEGKAACRVYPLRPEHCRTFPFREDVLGNEQVKEAVLRFCPGLRERNQA